MHIFYLWSCSSHFTDAWGYGVMLTICSLIMNISGQPRRHLLQSGWSVFVSSKRLVAGDAFIFLRLVSIRISCWRVSVCTEWSVPHRGENGELRVGVRRAMRQQTNVPSSVISSHSMHLGVLATAWHAVTTGTLFTVYYKPRCAVDALWCLGIFSYIIHFEGFE